MGPIFSFHGIWTPNYNSHFFNVTILWWPWWVIAVVARCGPLFNFWKNRSNLFGNLGNLGNFKKCRVDDQMTKLPTSRGMHGHLVTPNIPILQLPNYLPPKAHKVIWQLQSTLSLSCILNNFGNLSNFEKMGYFGNLGNSGNFGHLGNFDRLRMT